MAFAQLTQVFYEPSAAFAALKERPRAWLPLLLLYVAGISMVVWYFQTVDWEWMKAATLPPDLSAEQREAAGQSMTRGVMMGFGIAGVVLGTLVIFSLYGFYYWLAGKLASMELGFKSGFALVAWASLPSLISVPLMALQIATSKGQLAFENADMLSLNFLLVHAAPHTPWFGIASALKLTDIWVIVLTTIGLRTWTGKSGTTCAIIAALPYVLIYGCWAAWILFKN
ncbi:Yip1 domain-containing protein [Duganella sp. CF458]|uniref:YIP1 family protein n=1 Tax=Duganella sp. CF458 TaxID=1884368 RepID=UPI0008F12E6A|nr:YIP1 family protein [Duganella sp. CF458]SFG56850.1 Yip1 domain-containing protein [Duganella sp. CF458]